MLIKLDLSKTQFNLDYTLSCGQTFRWQRHDERWVGVVGQAVLKLQQSDGRLAFEGSDDNLNSEFVRRYFRLDDDLGEIYSQIAKDKYVRDAVNRFRGLRLLRQEPWECLISYICATHTSIPAIKRMICGLSRRFGRLIEFEGEVFYGFPQPQALAKASVRELRLCKLGYRAESVRETARFVDKGGFDLELLRRMPYAEAKDALLSLPGVGPKVADCVLLFSLDKLEAFPIDVWMKRIMLESYSEHFDPDFVDRVKCKGGLSLGEYRAIYDVGRRVFGDYLGYAQEYLYHFRRCQELGGKGSNLSGG
jgi:N-glycosylase/DNA lyase